jgi:hypothetical protein
MGLRTLGSVPGEEVSLLELELELLEDELLDELNEELELSLGITPQVTKKSFQFPNVPFAWADNKVLP